MTFRDRFQLSIECALVLFACSAGPGLFESWLHRAETNGGYLLVAAIPGLAAVGFLFATFFIRPLIPDGKMRQAMAITLPLVFCAMLSLAACLVASSQSHLFESFRTIRYALVWQQPAMLMLTLGFQIAALTLLIPLRGDQQTRSA